MPELSGAICIAILASSYWIVERTLYLFVSFCSAGFFIWPDFFRTKTWDPHIPLTLWNKAQEGKMGRKEKEKGKKANEQFKIETYSGMRNFQWRQEIWRWTLTLCVRNAEELVRQHAVRWQEYFKYCGLDKVLWRGKWDLGCGLEMPNTDPLNQYTDLAYFGEREA